MYVDSRHVWNIEVAASRGAQLTASFDVAGLPAQFRQVWRCRVVETLVDHDTESERDVIGDVESIYCFIRCFYVLRLLTTIVLVGGLA